MLYLFSLLTEALVSDWRCLLHRAVAAPRRAGCSLALLRHRGAAAPGLSARQGLQPQRWGGIMELRAGPEMVSACFILGAKEPWGG